MRQLEQLQRLYEIQYQIAQEEKLYPLNDEKLSKLKKEEQALQSDTELIALAKSRYGSTNEPG